MDALKRITDLTSQNIPEPFCSTSFKNEKDHIIFDGQKYCRSLISNTITIIVQCMDSFAPFDKMEMWIKEIFSKNRSKNEKNHGNILEFCILQKHNDFGKIILISPEIFEETVLRILNTSLIMSKGMVRNLSATILVKNKLIGNTSEIHMNNKNNSPVKENQKKFDFVKNKKKKKAKHLVRFIILHKESNTKAVEKDVEMMKPCFVNHEKGRITCAFSSIPDSLVKSFYKFDKSRILHPKFLDHKDAIFMFENEDLVCRKCKGYGHVEANCSNFLLSCVKKHKWIHYRHKNQILLRNSHMYDTETRIVFVRRNNGSVIEMKFKINNINECHEINESSCINKPGLSEDTFLKAWEILEKFAKEKEITIQKPPVINILTLNKSILLLENKINFMKIKKSNQKKNNSDDMEIEHNYYKKKFQDNITPPFSTTNVGKKNIRSNRSPSPDIKQFKRIKKLPVDPVGNKKTRSYRPSSPENDLSKKIKLPEDFLEKMELEKKNKNNSLKRDPQEVKHPSNDDLIL